ncbi:DUF2381 family protein [Archangium sp.]|uniref:DUF2381 family protein n=1 Tax=Archangium sp. TaxID=1872627 RepID=UPI00286C9B6D|nr:DUF2381 family protein [Archangium sp.]
MSTSAVMSLSEGAPVSALSSAALLSFVLLTTPLDAGAHAPLPTCTSGTRQVELMAGQPDVKHEVCIRPGRSTSFFFNAKLARVELPEPERFRVIKDETGFTLMATQALPAGERVPVTVSFQEGTPASATFTLVVHPSEVEHEVLVMRRERTVASYREGEQRALEEARQCRWENARLQVECTAQVGLTTLLSLKIMGEKGVPSKSLEDEVSACPGNTLTPVKAHSYRSDTGHTTEDGRKRVRLAVVQELRNTGDTPWTLAEAVLVGPRGEEWKALAVWPLKPIPPGQSGHVVVEVEVPEAQAHSTFTLKLWSQEGGARGELFDGVTFP